MPVMKQVASFVARFSVAAVLTGSFMDVQAASTPPSWPGPQGDSYASIAKLPNWSGFWAYHRVFVGPPGTNTGPGGEPMFLTPKYTTIAADHIRRRAQQNLSFCLPAGVPGVMQHRLLFQVLLTPGSVIMLFEDGEVRRIYTDERKHLPLGDQGASFLGDSIGHWEGGTLVVDTIGFPNGSIWENYGVLATIKSHLVERIFRNGAGYLEIDSVLTDPEIFARPYVYKRLYELSPIPITEEECLAGNRDTGTAVDLTPPPLGE